MTVQIAKLFVRGLGVMIDVLDAFVDMLELILVDTKRPVGTRDVSSKEG